MKKRLMMKMKRLELINGVNRLCEPGLNRSFSGLRRPFLFIINLCVVFGAYQEGEDEW
jgi:hypothetical protein